MVSPQWNFLYLLQFLLTTRCETASGFQSCFLLLQKGFKTDTVNF